MLLAHAALVCPRCGNLREECSDPTRDWHPRTEVCWPTATAEWASRRMRKRDDAAKDDDGLRYLDGRSVWTSTIPPAEGEDEFA